MRGVPQILSKREGTRVRRAPPCIAVVAPLEAPRHMAFIMAITSTMTAFAPSTNTVFAPRAAVAPVPPLPRPAAVTARSVMLPATTTSHLTWDHPTHEFAHSLRAHVSSATRNVGMLSPMRVTAISGACNVVLSLFKIGVGTLSGSASLIADGYHSAGDLVSDAFCLVSIKTGKYEHLCTIAISSMLVTTGLTMLLSSCRTLWAALASPSTLARASAGSALNLAALGVAFTSVVSKEALFWMTHAVGTRCESPSLIANAYHHRSDATSSLVAILGIIGVIAGFHWVDPLAATALGALITSMGWEVAEDSLKAVSQSIKHTTAPLIA